MSIDFPAGLVAGLLVSFVLALGAIAFYAQAATVPALLALAGALVAFAATLAWAVPAPLDQLGDLLGAVALGAAFVAVFTAGLLRLNERFD